MEQSSWNVGDIIWVVLPKKMLVIPARILELIVRKTLSGTDITHVIELPSKDGATRTMQLQETGGLGFSSLPEAEAYITEKAINTIREICDRASQTKKDFFEHSNIDVSESQYEEENIIELPDGTKARLKIPNELK